MSKREALERLGDRLTLPTLPEVVVKINRMISDPKVGVREIGAVVGADPALTAKVLKVANSAFYGLNEPVLSPEEAAAVIGVRALRNVAMQASIMKRFERFQNHPEFDLNELWSHAQETAQYSRALAGLVRLGDGLSAEDFYTCGLLHDVGKVLLLDSLGDEYLEVICLARDTAQTLHACEEQALGFTHVDVGALLAKRWELPGEIVKAIEFHHGPREAILGNPSVAIVSIADQVSYRSRTRHFEAAGARLADLARRILDVRPERFDTVLALARELTQAEQPAEPEGVRPRGAETDRSTAPP